MASSKVFSSSVNSYSCLYRLFDLFMLFAGFMIAAWLYGITIEKEYIMAPLVIAVVFLYMAESFDLYRSWRVGHFSEMVLVFLACISITFFIAVMLAFLLKQSADFSRVMVVLWFLSSSLLSCMWRFLQRQYIKACHRAGFNIKRVAVIGATDSANNLLTEIRKRDELGYDLIGAYDDRHPNRIFGDIHLDVQGKIEEAIALARSGEVEVVFIALPLKAEKRIADILVRLGNTTVDVHYIPDFLVSSLVHSRFSNVGEIDVLSVFESPYIGAKEWIKRTEDIIISAIILCLIAVPLLLIAIGVKLTSPGPVLFKQRRYGLRGEVIMVWKFRSMSVMENSDKVVQVTKGDARVTKFGHFLRRTSLDEFPQFFNVLAGSMSIVGPRPHAIAHNEQYRGQVRFYMLRHKVKPGVTGWAQINGWRGETDTLEKMENRVKFDLQYIKDWSVWLDIKIIFLTIFKGFTNPNAY